MAAPIDVKIKAAALADVLTGMTVYAVAKKHGVSRRAVSEWLEHSGLGAPVPPTPVRDQIWEEMDLYLLEALQTLRVVLKVGRDEAYLKSHDTAGLSSWHNAVADKVARIAAIEEDVTVGTERPTPIRRAT